MIALDNVIQAHVSTDRLRTIIEDVTQAQKTCTCHIRKNAGCPVCRAKTTAVADREILLKSALAMNAAVYEGVMWLQEYVKSFDSVKEAVSGRVSDQPTRDLARDPIPTDRVAPSPDRDVVPVDDRRMGNPVVVLDAGVLEDRPGTKDFARLAALAARLPAGNWKVLGDDDPKGPNGIAACATDTSPETLICKLKIKSNPEGPGQPKNDRLAIAAYLIECHAMIPKLIHRLMEYDAMLRDLLTLAQSPAVSCEDWKEYAVEVIHGHIG